MFLLFKFKRFKIYKYIVPKKYMYYLRIIFQIYYTIKNKITFLEYYPLLNNNFAHPF